MTTQGIEIESIRPAIKEIERWAQWVYKRKVGDRANLPPVTFLVQTKGAKKKQLGAFTASRYSTREGAKVHEITATAEELGRDVLGIVATVVHEVVHLANNDKVLCNCGW